jgi:site-specific recombinase XerD
MTRSNVRQRLDLAIRVAAQTQPQLKTRTISPHTFRHTTAMHLLESGVDITVIALWLGHESTATIRSPAVLARRADDAGAPLRVRA